MQHKIVITFITQVKQIENYLLIFYYSRAIKQINIKTFVIDLQFTT